MRKYLLAATALAAIASPAMARDGQPYVGIEGGILFAKDSSSDIFVDYSQTQTQTPTTPAVPAVPGQVDTRYPGAVGIDYKRGYDIDLIAGYDFGLFRLEAELARKRAKVGDFNVDAGFLTALNGALNRPSAAPDPGAPGQAALVAGNLDQRGRVTINSLMANALLDFGDPDGISAYAGVGAGRAFMTFDGDRDSAWAYQGIAGVRYALSSSVDIGLKYRYFRTGKVDLSDDTLLVTGNPNRTVVGTTNIDQTSTAVLFSDFERKFRSHSLLASLTFNFGGPAAEVVIAPPPPPPAPEPAPATQTCADGSVILASDACPPPPPPMPVPAPERG